MNTETMITELNAVAEKHKNDFVPTFQTNITAMCRDIIPKLEQLAKYEAIGTVEECQEARERQRAKKPIIKSKKKTKIQTGDYVDVKCPCCEEDIFSCFHYPPWNDSQKSHKHCENCGQAISWEGEE